jgi:hypothetical protein
MTNHRRDMIMGANSLSRRSARVVSLGLLLAFSASGVAFAQSCQEDFQKLSERRMSQISVLNKLGKSNKGKMDPVAACPVARQLSGIESEMLSYMEKNKEWCAIPDQVVDNFKQARAKTVNFASQACAFAAKAKKMQEQQREQAAAGGVGGQAQKLPSGPL